VEKPRHQPLAGPGLALDEEGRQPGAIPGKPEKPTKVASNRCDRRALSDQLLEVGHLNAQAYSNGRSHTTGLTGELTGSDKCPTGHGAMQVPDMD
jgi:hypothetical protein